MLYPRPVTTFTNPFPGSLEEELENPTAVMSSKSVSSSPQALSSQTSMGGSTTKISKRRSRSAIKPPIRVLSADRSTFRDMVQKLTGIPTSLSMEGNGFQQTWENNPSALIESMATRLNSQDDEAAAHSLRTLDTSSAYLLLNGPSQKALMHDETNSNNGFSFLQSLQHPQPHMTAAAAGGGGGGSLNAALYSEPYYYNPSSSGGGIDLKSLFVSQYAPSKGTNMYSEGEGGEVSPNMEHLHRIRQAAELESFLLMGNDKLDDFYPSRMLHNVDSWLSSDALELAYSA